MDIVSKFKDLERKFIDVERQMTNPEIVSDVSKYNDLNKTRTELEEPVIKFREYINVLDGIEDAETMIKANEDKELTEMAREELSILKEKKEELDKELLIMLIPKDPNDSNNAYLEVRSGTGGEEAAIFARDLFDMYFRYSQRMGWSTELIDENEADAGGLAKVVLLVKGLGVYSRLKFESGIHRVQRVPVTESSGRLHTSAATVAVMPEMINTVVNIEAKDLKIDTYRASGAGGQHINKTDSAVRITHLPTGIVVACQEERSQHKNKDKAMSLLQSKIWEAQEEERASKESAQRKQMVGSGDRSEKIRTYNYPQNRVTDHRINLTLYKLDYIMNGDLDELIDGLQAADQLEKLKNI
ncbi:MAG: peptide chain release factor 1 [Candidatus Riflemargulisbacteria bacterium]